MKYTGMHRVVCLAILISGCGKVVGADASELHNTSTVENSTAVTGSAIGNAVDGSPMAEQADSENAAINKRAMVALRQNLIGHATLDGEPIIDLVAQGSCASAFVTTKARANVDWSKVGNLAAETIGGRDVTIIGTVDGSKKVAVPSGDIADRVTMGMGLLAENCGATSDAG